MNLAANIFLFILFIAIFGSMGYIIYMEWKNRKSQYEELTDEDPVQDEIYEVALGKDTVWLSASDEKAFNQLSIKQRRALVAKQKAMLNQGKLILVDHPDGGKRMISRLEAIQKGVI
jgi:hypothetical protein